MVFPIALYKIVQVSALEICGEAALHSGPHLEQYYLARNIALFIESQMPVLRNCKHYYRKAEIDASAALHYNVEQ